MPNPPAGYTEVAAPPEGYTAVPAPTEALATSVAPPVAAAPEQPSLLSKLGAYAFTNTANLPYGEQGVKEDYAGQALAYTFSGGILPEEMERRQDQVHMDDSWLHNAARSFGYGMLRQTPGALASLFTNPIALATEGAGSAIQKLTQGARSARAALASTSDLYNAARATGNAKAIEESLKDFESAKRVFESTHRNLGIARTISGLGGAGSAVQGGSGLAQDIQNYDPNQPINSPHNAQVLSSGAMNLSQTMMAGIGLAGERAAAGAMGKTMPRTVGGPLPRTPRPTDVRIKPGVRYRGEDIVGRASGEEMFISPEEWDKLQDKPIPSSVAPTVKDIGAKEKTVTSGFGKARPNPLPVSDPTKGPAPRMNSKFERAQKMRTAQQRLEEVRQKGPTTTSEIEEQGVTAVRQQMLERNNAEELQLKAKNSELAAQKANETIKKYQEEIRKSPSQPENRQLSSQEITWRVGEIQRLSKVRDAKLREIGTSPEAFLISEALREGAARQEKEGQAGAKRTAKDESGLTPTAAPRLGQTPEEITSGQGRPQKVQRIIPKEAERGIGLSKAFTEAQNANYRLRDAQRQAPENFDDAHQAVEKAEIDLHQAATEAGKDPAKLIKQARKAKTPQPLPVPEPDIYVAPEEFHPTEEDPFVSKVEGVVPSAKWNYAEVLTERGWKQSAPNVWEHEKWAGIKIRTSDYSAFTHEYKGRDIVQGHGEEALGKHLDRLKAKENPEGQRLQEFPAAPKPLPIAERFKEAIDLSKQKTALGETEKADQFAVGDTVRVTTLGQKPMGKITHITDAGIAHVEIPQTDGGVRKFQLPFDKLEATTKTAPPVPPPPAEVEKKAELKADINASPEERKSRQINRIATQMGEQIKRLEGGGWLKPEEIAWLKKFLPNVSFDARPRDLQIKWLKNAQEALLKRNVQPSIIRFHPNIVAVQVFQHLPEVVKSLIGMSPERADRIVRKNTDPALWKLASLFRTQVKGVNLRDISQESPTAYAINVHAPGTQDTFFDTQFGVGAESGVAVRGRGILERLHDTLTRNFQTMNHSLVHEIGHSIFNSIPKNEQWAKRVRLLEVASRYMPYARETIADAASDFYKDLGRIGLANEHFAESFAQWWEGTGYNNDHESFAQVAAQALGKDVWSSILDIKQGRKAGETRLLWDSVSRDTNGEVPNRLASIMTRTSPASDATKQVIREKAADYNLKKEQAFDKFDGMLKAHSADGPDELRAWMDAAEGKPGAAPLPPEERAVADEFKAMFRERWEKLKAVEPGRFHGEGVAEYLKHAFTGNRSQQDMAKFLFSSRRPLEGPAGFAQNRYHQFLSDAMNAGAEPVSYNPIEMQLFGLHEMDKYLMAHEIKNELKDRGLIQWVKHGNQIPQGWQRLDDKIFSPRVPNEGTLVSYGQYYAPEEAARNINNFLSPGLRGHQWYRNLRTYGNSMNQFSLGMSAFHATMEALLMPMDDVALGLQQMSQGKILAGAGKMLRGASVVPSFLHHFFRGGDLIAGALRPEAHPNLQGMTEALKLGGGRIHMDPVYASNAVKMFQRARAAGRLGEAAWRAPFAAIELMAKPIMEHIVPRMKMSAFADMAQNIIEQHGDNPDMLRAELGKAWDSIDNRHGQLVYDNLFWNKTIKDLSMLSVRSVGWTVGTIRELGGAGVDTAAQLRNMMSGKKPELTSHMAFAMALPIMAGLYGALYQKFATGKDPEQLEDYYFPKTGGLDPSGKPERISLPTYMRDVYSWTKHPVLTAEHKLHPVITNVVEALNNADFYGREIYGEEDPAYKKALDLGAHVAKAFLPLSIRNYQEMSKRGAGVMKSGESFLGVTPAPAYIGASKAEEMAFNLARKKMPVGPRTKESYEQKQQLDLLRNQFNEKKISEASLQDMVKGGKISDDDLDKIMDESDQTPLQRYMSRLSPEEALKVWDVADKDERESLRDQMDTKWDDIDTYPEGKRKVLDEQFQKVLLQPATR